MILIISSDHVPHIGGKSTHIMDLMAGIKSNSEDVMLFSQAQYPKMMQTFIKLLLSPLRLYNINYFRYVYSKIWRVLLCKQTLKLYKQYKPTCISCQDAFAAASMKPIRDEIKCPIVLTMHTYFGLENALDNTKNTLLTKLYDKNLQYELISLEVVNKIVAVDNRILTHIKDTISSERKKRSISVTSCTSIENFTNTDIFSPVSNIQRNIIRKAYNIDENAFVIICARRLVEKNGVIYAVQAMKHFSDNSILVIAGDGPQKENIENEIQANNLSSKVVLLGSISSEKIVKLYQMADCSVVPSITVNGLQEATSISALEAMSCGLPTVASNIGGLTQIIKNGVSGYLVEEKDSLQIYEAVKKLHDVDRRKIIAQNARKYVVEEHSHINGAQKYLQQFK